MRFSRVFEGIRPSASMARGLASVPVRANFAIGSPDLQPPSGILEMVRRFCDSPDFAYKPSKGTSRARENIHRVVLDGATRIDPSRNLLLCPGAKMGIYLALKTLSHPDARVGLLEPYWLSYPAMCLALGLPYVTIAPSNIESGIEVGELAKSLERERVTVLLLNNPNNPAGSCLGAAPMAALLEACDRLGITVILDEVYKDLQFEQDPALHSWVDPELVVRVGSLSKSLSIPGLRIGYIASSEEFVRRADLLGQHINTCVSSMSSHVAEHLAASEFRAYVAACSRTYATRFVVARDTLTRRGLRVVPSVSSFYALVNVTPRYSSGVEASADLERRGIMVTPGIEYGHSCSDHVRICLTMPDDDLARYLEEF